MANEQFKPVSGIVNVTDTTSKVSLTATEQLSADDVASMVQDEMAFSVGKR